MSGRQSPFSRRLSAVSDGDAVNAKTFESMGHGFLKRILLHSSADESPLPSNSQMKVPAYLNMNIPAGQGACSIGDSLTRFGC